MWSDKDQEMWDLQYGISKNGRVEMPVPLANGETLVVTGTYYSRGRLKDDEQQYTNFMHKLWKAGKVQMIGSLGNKV